jgi:hypothetical protein
MEEKEENNSTPAKTVLFTLRAWLVNENTSEPHWRVRLQNVASGEVFYCNDGQTLISLLNELLIKTKKMDKF